MDSGHVVKLLFGTVDVSHDHGILWVVESGVQNVGQPSLDGKPLLTQPDRGINLDHRDERLSFGTGLAGLWGLAATRIFRTKVGLPLPGFARVLSAILLWWRGSVVDAVHVVMQVPFAGESISRLGPIATSICARVGLGTMAVHAVGLPLMTEQASGRREFQFPANIQLASVWLQVGVHKFTAHQGLVLYIAGKLQRHLLIVALQLLGPVVAALLSLPWAVVEAVLLWVCILVEVVVPGLTFIGKYSPFGHLNLLISDDG